MKDKTVKGIWEVMAKNFKTRMEKHGGFADLLMKKIKEMREEKLAKAIKGSGEDDGMVGDEDRDVMHNLKR